MQTLVINGSPRKDGDTAALVSEFVRHLDGEVKILDSKSGILPCSDCRFCRENPGCAIPDGMQEVYTYLETCDNIVLASPIWFSALSGPLMNITSRIQTFFCAQHFRKKAVTMRRKNGVIILVGAEKGTEVTPAKTALTIMKFLNVNRDGVMKIFSLNTDITPAAKDKEALARCRKAAEALNLLCSNSAQP